jgi:hypothetical protein
VLDTTYCGYVNFLIVVIFRVAIFLLIILIIFFIIFLLNAGVLVLSRKVFNVGFFGDFELILRV